jgi:hypothetical protein
MGKVVTVICKECGAHFKAGRSNKLFHVYRSSRRENNKMPIGFCPACAEKMMMRRHEQFRSGIASHDALENAKGRKNFRVRRTVRPWAWRELDD